jgi:hypothetical protein
MAEKSSFIIGKGWVHSRDLFYVYGVTRQSNIDDAFESVVLRYSNGNWGLWQVATRLCAICTGEVNGERVVVTVGIDGLTEISDEHGTRVLEIDSARGGPDHLKHITFARRIGDRVYAVGMSRMVYYLELGSSTWLRMDEGTRVGSASTEIAGFKAIDGDGRGRYVACGLFGELWLYENGSWLRLASPTNAKLETVRWVADNRFVAAGGGGIVISGTPDALDVRVHPDAKHTFWASEWFGDCLYLATRNGTIWTLDADSLKPVDISGGKSVTTGWLHANDGVMLSVGEHDLLLYDGVSWTAVEQPSLDSDWPLRW